MDRELKRLVSTIAFVGIVFSASADSVSYDEDFSEESGVTGWSAVQSSPATLVQWNSAGYMVMNVRDGTPRNETIGYTVPGTLRNRDALSLSVRLGNSHNNYYRGYVQLWNVTEDRLLAESAQFTVYGASDSRYGLVDVDLSYSAGPDDSGDVLQLRIQEDCNASYRNLSIDRISFVSKSARPVLLLLY